MCYRRVMEIQPLIVDCYQGDLHGHPAWSALARLGAPWHGAIIKATEGVGYSPEWFDENWQRIGPKADSPIATRYGVDWFRGCYHFLKFGVSGKAQADYYLTAVARAGGWSVGDFWPIVDVEMGGEGNANRRASAQEVIDCTTEFAERCTAETGRKVMLYGNGAMRDLGIRDKMGCSYLWLPRYTSALPKEIYERAGWTFDELVMWQYCGDGYSVLSGYPAEPAGFGKVDISALVMKGGMEWLRDNLWAEKSA